MRPNSGVNSKTERAGRSWEGTRVLLGAVGVTIVAGLSVLQQRYRADIRDAYAAIENADSDVVATSRGRVEYRTVGEGVPVLISHGIVGGFDQALRTGEHLLDGDAHLVGVSRFGYLGSALPKDPTPESQARAYVEVLDRLELDDVVVIGTSAGGAPAIRFALDYPDRTRGLVLIGSTAPSPRTREGPTGPPHMLLRDPVFWLLVRYAPWVFHRLFGIERADYDAAPPKARRRVQQILDTLVPVRPRKPGILNDERVTNTAMSERYDEYNLGELAVHTLVIHAVDDPLASFEDVQHMVDRLPDVEFRRYDTGGHLVFGHGDEISRLVTDFVRSQ